MPRVVSFIVLLAIVLLVGAVFFRVMSGFVVPLFLACVLLVVFQPLHAWIQAKIPSRARVAALLTTATIVLAVLLPLGLLGWMAVLEGQALYESLQVAEAEQQDGEQAGEIPAAQAAEESGQSDDPTAAPSGWTDQVMDRVQPWLDRYEELAGHRLNVESWVGQASSVFGSVVLSGVQTIFGLLVGLAIMVLSLYYFLADGPGMVSALMQLSPLDDAYEHELLAKFSQISRAVVVATLLSAVVQGLAAGIGYYFALPAAAPIFLLMALTMVFAIVPFVGAAGVWVPTCLWLFFFADSRVTAVLLAVYCTALVSSLDNVIKPLVLHGQSNLHPLLALLSILGGVQVLGPIGILVGPMLVSFLQALLNMLNKELAGFGEKGDNTAEKLAAVADEASQAINQAADTSSPELGCQTASPAGGGA